MKKTLAFVVLATFVAGCTATATLSDESAAPEPAAEAQPAGPPQPMDFGPLEIGTAPDNPYSAAQIARGEYLVSFGGCNDCHTPWNIDETGAPVLDRTRMLSGHPRLAPGPSAQPGAGDTAVIGPTFTSFALPFGTTYALNLTPDVATGSGSWTEEMFLKMFSTARHLGGDGRTILPPMPWFSITSLTHDDQIAIFAYLRSIPPIVNAVPSSEIPAPVLEGLAMGNAAMLAEIAAIKAARQ